MTPSPAIIPLLALPALVAGLVYFLRPWERTPQIVAFLAAVTAAYLVRSAAPGLSGDLMGRPLVLDGPARQLLLIALAAVALGNLALAIYPIGGFFPSVSLLSASLVGVVASIDNLTLASLFLLINGVMLALAWGTRGRARGHLQFLVAVTVGCLALAYAASLMDAAPDEPSRMGLIAFEIGAGLLLALMPFGFWEGMLGRDADPLTTSTANLTFKATVLVLVWRFSAHYPWLAATSAFPQLLRVAVLITVAYCSLRTAVAPSARAYAAVATQAQFTLALLTLIPALGSSSLLPVTGLWLLARVPTSLFLATAALALQQSRRLLPRLLFVFAGLALAGLPGTPVFPAYLASLLSLPRSNDLLLPLGLLTAGLVVGALRLLWHGGEQEMPDPPALSGALTAAVVLALIVLALGLQPSRLLLYLS